jgi:hypothetical protein
MIQDFSLKKNQNCYLQINEQKFTLLLDHIENIKQKNVKQKNGYEIVIADKNM